MVFQNFRGVQLDLARQMETMDKINEFIDFIAANGYNHLLLYLEGRIKTESFNCIPDEESYSPEQMRKIIAYAETKNIETIPGLACLGHAEMFLEYPEFSELAELRDGRNGRHFNNRKRVFCLSQPETRNFLEKYLTEICEIFPSQFINIGLDEAWDVGYCDKCSARIESFRDEQEIFLEAITFCHSVVTQKLGRRTMMWDDMFEYYPDILPDIPRDIIMVCWQYQNDVRFIKGHFSNSSYKRTLAVFNELDFETIIAPVDYSTANIRTFFNFAQRYSTAGMLVTSWEKQNCLRLKSLPVIAYGGRIGKSHENDEKLFRDIVYELFGIKDELLVKTVRSCCEHQLSIERVLTLDNLLSTPCSGLDNGYLADLELLQANLVYFVDNDNLTALGKLIVDDLLCTTRYHILKFRLRRMLLAVYDPELDFPNADEEIEYLLAGFSRLREKRIADWNIHRKNIKPNYYEEIYTENVEFIKGLPELIENIDRNLIVRIRFCLPDKYSSEKCTISLKLAGKWLPVKDGFFKNPNNDNALWENLFPVSCVPANAPEAVRFEAAGFGGQGLAYIEVYYRGGRYVPDRLTEAKDVVENPEYVLDNDCKWCFIGEQDTVKAFRNRSLSVQTHSVEYNLKKVNTKCE